LQYLASFLELLRLKFKPLTGRNIIKIHEYIVKTYNDAGESAYECSVLSNIALSKPITFRVPKVFKLLKAQSHSALIMEYIAGYHLDNYILNFLLCGNSDAVKIFYQLGKAVKELHNLDLHGLRNSFLPSSSHKLKNEVIELSGMLVIWKIIDYELFKAILNSLKNITLTNEIFLNVSLHGELYFTHVLVQGSKIILLDFHNMQRGPAYFDLATFIESLYVSLVFSSYTPKQFALLTEAFLKGYYGKDLNAEISKSIELAVLYVFLRSMRNLYAEDSLVMRLLNILGIRRFKVAIKEVILPKLTA
jgi:tRNA A-37 threonylcarbamoyl transferase component Bud32